MIQPEFVLIWSVVQRLDVFRWENSHTATTAPSPTTRARAVQQVYDVTTAEVEVGCLWGSVVTKGVSETSFLDGGRAETWHQTKWFVSQRKHKTFAGTSWFVIPPQLPQADVWSTLLPDERGERGESRGGLRGGTPESSFYKGWGKGCVQAAAAGAGVREDLSGRPLSPRRCCEFCKSLPTGWGSKMTHPRCSTARHLPTPGNAPPCLRSCKIRVRGEGVDGGVHTPLCSCMSVERRERCSTFLCLLSLWRNPCRCLAQTSGSVRNGTRVQSAAQVCL